jgi:hypothetical protein
MTQLPFTAMPRVILLLLVLYLIPSDILVQQVRAQGIVFNGVTPIQNTVAKWDTYEALISLTATYTNKYDYNDIAIQAIFTSPTGKQRTVDAFWMDGYSINFATGDLTPTDTSGFRIRFTPDEPGQWSYVLSGRLQGGTATTSSAYTFTCSGTSPAGKGYIRRGNTSYLRWDNGSQYIPIGENIAYPAYNMVPNYDYYFNKIKPVGMNFIRIWMATWGVGLEWTNGPGLYGFNGLKQYKQTAAKVLDYWLERGKADGFAIMLCLNYHDQFRLTNENGQWNENPYNTALGGPCDSPQVFFTNAAAKDIFKNRLRYMVARWGYAGSLQSWELFNEVDNVHGYLADSVNVHQWHNEMAAYLKSIDPNHLVTSSFGDERYGHGTWNSSSIDITQSHKYKLDPNLPRLLSNINQQRVVTYQKPTINGEFGLSYDHSAEVPYDPNGISLHNAIWATMFSGAMGSAVPWWWEHWIDPQNLYGHFAPLAAFKDVVPFESGNYRKAAALYLNTNPSEATIIPEGQWPADEDDPPPVLNFTLDNEGQLTPGVGDLCQFIYGMGGNTQFRRPPTFHVSYLKDGSFSLLTGSQLGTNARISIYIDGVLTLDQVAQVNTTYSVQVPAGSHAIKVDNLGGDWAWVVRFQFVNAVGPLNTYALKNAGNNQAAGYISNRLYNYRYFLDNNNTAPPVVPAGAIVRIPGMANGAYNINYYSCEPTSAATPAQPISTRTATAVNDTLTFSVPEVAWDLAFTATAGGSSPGPLTSVVSVSPGVAWGAATSGSFVVSNAGIAPDASSLGMYIYGSLANTQYRNPPTFVVNYAQTGYFEVYTGTTMSQGFPRVTVYVDGVKMLDQPTAVSTSYLVTIPPGLHSIMVDNSGGDWTFIDHYSFLPTLAPPPATVRTGTAKPVHGLPATPVAGSLAATQR